MTRIARIALCAIAALSVAMLSGCSTIPSDQMQPDRPGGVVPRWEVNEVPYDEARLDEKIGRNVRDGLVGLIDSIFEGAFCMPVIASQTGFLTQKVVIFTGDVIGLIDDNPWTEHVLKGVLSKQLLKFGSRAMGMPKAVARIHETKFDYPEMTLEDYIGNEPFHGRAYVRPGGLTTLGAILVGDFLIRPAGNLLLMVGMRETSENMHQSALDLIEASLGVPFL